MPSNTQAVGVAYSDPEFTTCYASQEIGYSDRRGLRKKLNSELAKRCIELNLR